MLDCRGFCAHTYRVEKSVHAMVTAPGRVIARRIARVLVENRLAACVQIVGPVESTYRWQGRVDAAREWLCLIKTTRARFSQVAGAVEALHPYDTPEVIAVPIVAGSQRYLDWLAEAVRASLPKPGPTRSPGCR